MKNPGWQFWFAVIGAIVSGVMMFTDLRSQFKVNSAETLLTLQTFNERLTRLEKKIDKVIEHEVISSR